MHSDVHSARDRGRCNPLSPASGERKGEERQVQKQKEGNRPQLQLGVVADLLNFILPLSEALFKSSFLTRCSGEGEGKGQREGEKE